MMMPDRNKGDPTDLEMDDRNDPSDESNRCHPWEVSHEFERRTRKPTNWSSWDDSSPDASCGGPEFLG